MRSRLFKVFLAVAVLAAAHLSADRVHAQGLTGQISGTVVDSGGGVMPGATVTLKNAGTNAVRDTVTGADGTFVFPDLLAGTYDISVGIEGFKTYEQKGIVLGATERVALRAISLEVGGLSGDGDRHERSHAGADEQRRARSGLVEREQIEDIALKGRDFAGYLKLLPGVIDTSAREAPGWGSMGGLSINGRGGGVQLLLRRRHQQGHRVEQRQLRGAGARLDRRGPRADVELPGRIRPQLGRDDHGRHAERLEGLPWQRRVLQARRYAGTATSSRGGSSAGSA